VLALHEMMRAREPSVLGRSDDAEPGATEADLRSLMRDPRYWRDRDPALVAKVTEGFKRLYPS
jgi:Phage T7 capsid assembly protein